MCASNVCGEHMHECACLHMYSCMWKPGVNVKCHPQSLSTLYTEPESMLHRAQLYWNSGQPACFRDILSPFLLHWDYIQATTPIQLLLGSGDFFFLDLVSLWDLPLPKQAMLASQSTLGIYLSPVSAFSTLVLQACTITLGSLQGCLTQALPHACMANMFTKLAIFQFPNASFLLVSFLAPRANAYANRYEYMLLSL